MPPTLRSSPGNSWPVLPHEPSSQAWIAHRHLERTQWLAAAEIESRQFEQCRSLLAHAIVHVPYYRRTLPEAGIVPGQVRDADSFERVPFLDRQTIRARPQDFAARELPGGTQASGKLTFGVPGEAANSLRRTNVTDVWTCALFLRDLEWCGVRTAGTVALIRPTFTRDDELAKRLAGIETPALFPPLRELIDMGVCHLMDMQQDPARQIEWLRRIDPETLVTYPSNLAQLATIAQPLRSLRVIQAIGGSLPDEERARLGAVFGAPVRSNYRCREVGLLASPCLAKRGWHVHAEAVRLEIVDAHGQRCPPGQRGRVCITTLHNFHTPLIRYLLPDEAVWGEGACACGRGLPWLTHIHIPA